MSKDITVEDWAEEIGIEYFSEGWSDHHLEEYARHFMRKRLEEWTDERVSKISNDRKRGVNMVSSGFLHEWSHEKGQKDLRNELLRSLEE